MNDRIDPVLLQRIEQRLRRPAQASHRALKEVPVDGVNFAGVQQLGVLRNLHLYCRSERLVTNFGLIGGAVNELVDDREPARSRSKRF